jgi:hypothetical protein
MLSSATPPVLVGDVMLQNSKFIGANTNDILIGAPGVGQRIILEQADLSIWSAVGPYTGQNIQMRMGGVVSFYRAFIVPGVNNQSLFGEYWASENAEISCLTPVTPADLAVIVSYRWRVVAV